MILQLQEFWVFTLWPLTLSREYQFQVLHRDIWDHQLQSVLQGIEDAGAVLSWDPDFNGAGTGEIRSCNWQCGAPQVVKFVLYTSVTIEYYIYKLLYLPPSPLICIQYTYTYTYIYIPKTLVAVLVANQMDSLWSNFAQKCRRPDLYLRCQVSVFVANLGFKVMIKW
jgi:hypothetical protein